MGSLHNHKKKKQIKNNKYIFLKKKKKYGKEVPSLSTKVLRQEKSLHSTLTTFERLNCRACLEA